MTEEDLDIARELKRRLSERVPLINMRLFGSRARGDSVEGSDMDMFVEVAQVSSRIKDLIADTAWELGLEHLIHISPLVFSQDEIENTPQRSSPVVNNIMREGIRI